MSSTYKAVIVGKNFKKDADGTPLSYDTYKVLGGAEINCMKILSDKELIGREVIATDSDLSKIKQVYPNIDYDNVTKDHEVALSIRRIYKEDIENLIKAINEEISRLYRELTMDKEDLISRIKNSIEDKSIPTEELRERTTEALSIFNEDELDINDELEDYKYLLEDLNRIKNLIDFYDNEYHGFTSEESYDEIELLVIRVY